MKRIAFALALLLPLLAYPSTLLLEDRVAVTYCGGKWTTNRVYVWPCVIYRNGFDR